MANFPPFYAFFPLSFALLSCLHSLLCFLHSWSLYPSFLLSSAAEGCISRCHESFCLIAPQTRRQRGRAIVPYIWSCAASLLPLGERWRRAAFMTTITPDKHSPAAPAARCTHDTPMRNKFCVYLCSCMQVLCWLHNVMWIHSHLYNTRFLKCIAFVYAPWSWRLRCEVQHAYSMCEVRHTYLWACMCVYFIFFFTQPSHWNQGAKAMWRK